MWQLRGEILRAKSVRRVLRWLGATGMSELDTVIVAHKRNGAPKRAFTSWTKAHAWQDAIDYGSKYILSETLVNDMPEVESE